MPRPAPRAADPAAEVVAFRHELLELLAQQPPDDAELLEILARHEAHGHPVYSALLSILVHLDFSEATARRHWKRILGHRALLRERLGRDPGLRVALLDYFANFAKELRSPTVIEISIFERTERSAVSDGLTGLYNHAFFAQALRREVLRARRHGHALSLLLFDLDNFKKVNDSRGHLAGDRVLVKVAALVQSCVREIDVAARYGGEEFAVILPDTSGPGAHVVAERIRRRIDDHFRRGKGPRVTISGGVASFPEDGSAPEHLIERADALLYRSKAEGKNRVLLSAGERRRHLRLPASVPVRLQARAGRGRGRVQNVSAGGLLVRLPQPPALGEQVHVAVGGEAMVGEVVRVLPAPDRDGQYEVGLRLLAEDARLPERVRP